MHKPPSIEVQRNLLIVRQDKQQLCLHISREQNNTAEQLVCHFEQNQHDVHAAVTAPEGDVQQLAHRAVSYVSAYLRIEDRSQIEQQLLKAIDGSGR
ncbi:MAG: hypothetical protein R3E95_01780 [Thiolinea sp.]